MKNLNLSLDKINLKINGRLFGFGTSPTADWKIIFTSSVILGLLVIVLSIFIFIKINNGESVVLENTVKSEEDTLNLSFLKDTVSYYQNKEIEFEKIKNAKAVSIDPSL